MRRNVLLFHAGAIGDFVLTWPIALGLARSMAQHRVMFVTHSSKGELAERAIGVEFRDHERFSGLFAEDAALEPAAQKLIENAALILSFVSDGTDAWAKRVAAVAPESRRIFVQPRPPAEFARHVTDFHLEQLAADAPVSLAATQMLEHVKTNGLCPQGDSRTVLIHPGSGGKHKIWPAERFASLASRLRARGFEVKIVLGEVERERFSTTEVRQLESSAKTESCETLIRLYELIRSAGVFVGNDSGPAHLAGVCGARTFSLFGASNDVQWRPVGPRVHVVKHDPIGELEVETVIEAIAANHTL